MGKLYAMRQPRDARNQEYGSKSPGRNVHETSIYQTEPQIDIKTISVAEDPEATLKSVASPGKEVSGEIKIFKGNKEHEKTLRQQAANIQSLQKTNEELNKKLAI